MSDPFNSGSVRPGPEEEALRSVVEDIHRRFLEQGETVITTDDWTAYHNANRRLTQKGWRTRAVIRTVLDRVVLEPIPSTHAAGKPPG